MNYQGVTGRRDAFINLPRRSEFDIKITGKEGTNPTKHSWVKVQRRPDHKWEELAEMGSIEHDPAFDYSGAAAVVGDVRPAFRHPATGEVLFFLSNRQIFGASWPVGLWGFHGILEFGYFDFYDEMTETLVVNPAVVDKEAIANIQDFRLKSYLVEGVPKRFRGASGWFFQANASTSSVRVNTTTQDERDVGSHDGWGNIVEAWINDDLGSFDTLVMGLPTFGGYYYGTVDEEVATTHEAGPGPIRMSYLYGDTFATLNNRLQFQWQGLNKAKLTGWTPAIPNWSSSGSLVPDSPDSVVDALAGGDVIVPLDGLRGIRIRVLGWHAHMADHACKPFDTFTGETFPAGMNFVWRENASAFADDEGSPIGQFTPQSSIDPITSEIIYGDKIEFTGFHHYYFGQWSDGVIGGPPRYEIDLKTKVWYVSEDDPIGFRPDPFKVLVGNQRHEADSVIHTDALERKTVHQPPDPIFNVDASFANNVGFVIDFGNTVDNIAWIHQEWRHDGKLIGAQFWGGRTSPVDGTFGVSENYHNAIAFQKVNMLDRICDNMEAAMICAPIGIVDQTPLPKAYVAAKSFAGGATPARFRIIRVWDFPADTEYDVTFSDETTLVDVNPLEFEHDIDRPFWADLTVKPPGQPYATHRTWFGEAGFTYQEFCDIIADNAAIWNQLDGLLVVKINGTPVAQNDAGDFTGGVTVSFEFSASLQQFLDENTDVTISYEWETVCSGVPKLPVTGSGSVTHNGTVFVPFTDNCGGDYREADMILTMTTPTNRALFDTTCSPWGKNQGISARTVYFTFSMYP